MISNFGSLHSQANKITYIFSDKDSVGSQYKRVSKTKAKGKIMCVFMGDSSPQNGIGNCVGNGVSSLSCCRKHYCMVLAHTISERCRAEDLLDWDDAMSPLAVVEAKSGFKDIVNLAFADSLRFITNKKLLAQVLTLTLTLTLALTLTLTLTLALTLTSSGGNDRVPLQDSMHRGHGCK